MLCRKELYSCTGTCRKPQTLFCSGGAQHDQTSEVQAHTLVLIVYGVLILEKVPAPPSRIQHSKWPLFKLSPRTSPSLVRMSSFSASGTPRSA